METEATRAEPEISVSIERLTKDLRAYARGMTRAEARYIVNTYYALQKNRIAAFAQAREAAKSGDEHRCIAFVAQQMFALENRAKSMLDVWSAQHEMGRWARGYCGIGPVLASGLVAHIDIERAKTPGNIYSFAGIAANSKKWERGKKRPWNAELKTLCWKIANSFVRQSLDKSFYRRLYDERKAYEERKNEAGDYAAQAKAKLESFNIGKDTIARKWYEQGKLPPGHIHARAMRYVVKIFLSHWWETAYRLRFNTEPPKPYAIAHMGHVDYIPPPPFEKVFDDDADE